MKTTPGQDIDAPMKIFVGGLTEHLADITESDIRNIFPFGEIDYIDMHKDPNTGKSRGYCFIQFRKGTQARAAISAMNEFEYMGKILKVGPAEEANKNGNEMLLPSAEDDEGNTAVLHNIQSRQTLMQKLNKDNIVMPTYFPGSAMPLPTGMTPNPLMMMQNQGMGIPSMYQGMMPPNMPIHPNVMNMNSNYLNSLIII
jgi:RNA recognition motif-containing protein